MTEPSSVSRMRRSALHNPVLRTILSAWSWLVLAALLILWLPAVTVTRLVTASFDRGRYAAGRLFRLLAVAHQKLNPLWRFRTHGAAPGNPRLPYVVVANHESFADILLLSHLPWEMKWLAKSSFFSTPVVGWLMRMAGDIPLYRSREGGGARAMEAAGKALDTKVSVMIFPEGTRSRGGDLADFKTGAFRLAIEKGAPVLPVAVRGTRSALLPNDWRFGVAEADAWVLDPIPTDGLTLDDAPALAAQAREAIESFLAARR